MSESLIILGANVRAAAFSAQRSGFDPYCADLFADDDLTARFETVRIGNYPDDFPEVISDAPMGGWIYTGGVENYPAIVDKISATKSLYGNPGSILTRVRNPKKFADALARGGLPYPAVNDTGVGLPRDGSWLRKNRGSTGGLQVQIWDPRTTAPRDDPEWYFQQRINGQSVSAVYVCAGGQAILLGVTQQLIGTDWTGATGFLYAGSVGPMPLDARVRSTFEQVGNQLGYEFGLLGLFGIDAVLAEGTVWPVEINPRYPASVEILERALGLRTIELHVDACRRGKLPEAVPTESRRWSGKAIMYARKDVVISDAFIQRTAAENQGTPWPSVADIPPLDRAISAGSPVTTVFGEGEDYEELEKVLKERISRLEAVLY